MKDRGLDPTSLPSLLPLSHQQWQQSHELLISTSDDDIGHKEESRHYILCLLAYLYSLCLGFLHSKLNYLLFIIYTDNEKCVKFTESSARIVSVKCLPMN